jgi:hypothetical protein
MKWKVATNCLTGFYPVILLAVLTTGCMRNPSGQPVNPELKVSGNNRYLVNADEEPFFWMGGTAWGMSEWLTREDVDIYFDNRAEKGFNLVQVCLFWGKREENPVRFTVNPTNAYGHKAFVEVNGKPDPEQPRVIKGGTPQNPNDYWDHVDYIIQSASKRNMIIAVLPVWGRRYVNATHPPHSEPIFSISGMRSYSEFLGERFMGYSNIVWVLGGDVQADAGGDHLDHYRSMAEGIITGITGETIHWDEDSPLWDQALITYHPDGAPLKNSSRWFHNDPWMDFNMIETHRHREMVYQAVQQDYALANPVKPTVMGEPDYEGARPNMVTASIHMRRQALQSFFAGAAGFTYGGKIDQEGNGPLWSPYNNWKEMLDMDGAKSMKNIKSFCLSHKWPDWKPVHDIIQSNMGEGEYQKVAVFTRQDSTCLIYFPDISYTNLDLANQYAEAEDIIVQWYNPAADSYSEEDKIEVIDGKMRAIPPDHWPDAILIIKGK